MLIGIAIAFVGMATLGVVVGREKRRPAVGVVEPVATPAFEPTSAPSPPKSRAPVPTTTASVVAKDWVVKLKPLSTNPKHFAPNEVQETYGSKTYWYKLPFFTAEAFMVVTDARDWSLALPRPAVSIDDLGSTTEFAKSGLSRWLTLDSGPFKGEFVMETDGTVEIVSVGYACRKRALVKDMTAWSRVCP